MSTNRLLSDEEVDALLCGVAVSGGPARARDVRPLDLTQRERSLRGLWPGLDLVAERFAREAGTALSGLLGRPTAVRVAALELLTFAHAAARFADPLLLHVVRLAPLSGHGLVHVGPQLAAPLLEVAFGGQPERATPITGRSFSAIEQRGLARLVPRFLQALADAWQPIGPLAPALLATETELRLAQIAAPEDLVALVELRADLDGGEAAALSVCLPDATLAPVRRRLQAHVREGEPASDAWTARWRAALAGAPLEVSAELGTRRLSLRQVLRLAVGDVIPLGTGREGPVVVRIEGRPCFVAAPGVAGSANAVRVTARL